MAIRPILIHPDPRLKKVCAPIDGPSEALNALLDDMLETMYDAPGIGLAAPQVGVLSRVVVLDVAKDEAPPEPLRLINPEILAFSEEKRVYNEGCLSIPEQYVDIERPARVRVRYRTPEWAVVERDCDGLLATCMQHEIDHLNGKLFVDYLGPVKRSMILGKMKKLKRDRAREAARGP